MDVKSVLSNAFAMPITSPAFPMGPYRFIDREFLIITYRTDPDKLRAVVPEPLEIESRWCITSSSACRTRRASAITRKAAR